MRITGVDDARRRNPKPLAGCAVGVVVAKRFAPNAVTRNLIRRVARQALMAHGRGELASTTSPGQVWVIRTREPVLTPGVYRSASSPALKTALAVELAALLAQVQPKGLPARARSSA